MQTFVLLIIGCVMLTDFLVKTFSLPTILHFSPELLSGIVVIYVAIKGTRNGFRLVAAKYWAAFGVLGLLVLCGIIDNRTGVGQVLSGTRFYLRAVPMFFLPSVLLVSGPQLERQLKFLLGFAFLQLPIAVYQRWIVLSEGRFTGDEVRGTLMDSGVLSIFLIGVVLVLTGLLMRNRIGKLTYAALAFLVLIPSVINETKGTLVMLPFALMVTLIMGAQQGRRLRYAGFALAGLVGFVAFFVPVYNMMEMHNPYKNEKDITNFVTNQKQLSKYMSSNVGGVGTNKDVRRNEAIGIPLQYLARDPAQFAFGLGIGNVSPSNFGKNFEGSYFLLFKKFLITSLTFFILEFGVLGTLVIGVLFAMAFFDALVVARADESLTGALATGWTGVIALVALGMLYTILHEFTSITYLSWYFTGVICARRVALAQAVRYVAKPVSRAELQTAA